MNILFLYGSIINPLNGGVQRVTRVLADYFESKGHSIFFLSLTKPSSNDNYDTRQFTVPDNSKFYTDINILFFEDFIKQNKINIVVNQGGLGQDCSLLAYRSANFGVFLISVLHNSLLAPIYNFRITKQKEFNKINLHFLLPLTDLQCVKKIILLLYKLKYKKHFKNLYIHSDKVVLLSEKFKNEILFFIKNKHAFNKTIAISNPCSFSLRANYKIPIKEKTILFVGRIDFAQKRVDLLLNIWNKIHLNFKDWTLCIIGDGPDLVAAKEIVKHLQSERVLFKGIQNPEEYYLKASIFCMTSSFEGFGLVIIEAQTYGVIPVVFNSFASVTDIIENGKSGFLIDPFDEDKYIKALTTLMNNPDLVKKMSKNCIANAKNFSIEIIGNSWLNLFNSLPKYNAG